MAIAEDASTPAVTHSSYGTTGTATTASFSPPANSLVVVAVNCLVHVGTNAGTLSCQDSLGNTYTQGCGASGTSASAIFTYRYASAPGSITVTVTVTTASVTQEFQIAPRVLTGAAVSQAGAAAVALGSPGVPVAGENSVTTTAAGSWVYVLKSAGGGGTADANTVNLEPPYTGGANSTGYAGRQSAATVTPGATTLGWTGVGSIGGATWVALEILPLPPAATAPAGLATGIGAALATAFTYAAAGLATGAGLAQAPSIGGQAVAVTAGLAAASGLAQPAQARYPVTALAGLATASGTAQSATTHGPIPAVKGSSTASVSAGATSRSAVGEAATCTSSVT